MTSPWILRGHIPLRIWQNAIIKTYLEEHPDPWGWLGHAARTPQRDDLLVGILQAHDATDDEIATYLTSRLARHLGDDLPLPQDLSDGPHFVSVIVARMQRSVERDLAALRRDARKEAERDARA